MIIRQYHADWSELMPVVEKISRLNIDWNDATITDTYYPRTFGMLNPDTGLPMVRINSMCLYEGKTLIEATFLAVYNFIQWWNSKEILEKISINGRTF